MADIPVQEFEQLKSVSLFRELSQVEFSKVIQLAYRRKLLDGEFLFMEADPATTLYVLVKGRLKLTQVTPEGQQVILRYITPGEAIGVIAVLSGALYPVSAQAVESSQLLGWENTAMRRLMSQVPSISMNALQILAGRVREFQDRVRELSTERVERRIARTLLRLARQTGRKVNEGVLIDLPLSRQDLAEMTGTTLYTVSRLLSQWETRGLIKSKREQVTICSPHDLVIIAEDLPPRDVHLDIPGEQL